MEGYKVCVYAIAKDEAKFAARWAESMSEADAVYVLDTGSSDDTVKILQAHGVNVRSEIITPWRFDTARNRSLELVPEDADICVCTDIDEVLHPGWRAAAEKRGQTARICCAIVIRGISTRTEAKVRCSI